MTKVSHTRPILKKIKENLQFRRKQAEIGLKLIKLYELKDKPSVDRKKVAEDLVWSMRLANAETKAEILKVQRRAL